MPSSCLYFSLESQVHTTVSQFYVGARDLTSGPHASSASTLSPGLSPAQESALWTARRPLGEEQFQSNVWEETDRAPWAKVCISNPFEGTEDVLSTECLRGAGNSPHSVYSECSEIFLKKLNDRTANPVSFPIVWMGSCRVFTGLHSTLTYLLRLTCIVLAS